MYCLNSIFSKFELKYLFWAAVIGLHFACQSSVDVTEAPSVPLNIEKILVLPFEDMSVLQGENIDARCPVCGRIFITGEVADGADRLLTDKLVSWLQSNTHFQILVSNPSQDTPPLFYSTSGEETVARNVLADVGRKNKADAVLVGFLYRFRERVGKGYSVESPASVAFGMHLIRTADAHTIWSANFDETQKSLGENLFQLGSFLSRGGRWVTAEDMAVSGLDKILKKFPR